MLIAAASLFHAGRYAGDRRRHALLDRLGHALVFGRRLARISGQRGTSVGHHGKTAPVLTGVGGFVEALIASRLVWEAILRMASTMVPIC